ncbi:MAG: ATP-binding protein [Bacteroidetes bacterium]|nr:ATP-binding protein [Bacteroidota bacterium]
MKTSSVLTLHAEIDWLQQVIDQVIRSYLLQEGHEKNWQDIPLPDLDANDTPYAQKVNEWNLDVYGRMAMALVLTPHIRPEMLDVFFGKNAIYDRGFTEFGGLIDKNHSGFLPTGQTLCFLITATSPDKRIEVMKILGNSSVLIKEQVVVLAEMESHVPGYSGALSMPDRWLHYFLTGEELRLEHSASFPAQIITTNLEWEDVVLDHLVMDQVQEIITWLQHGSTLLNDWGLLKKIKPGYRALFFGPPGTGKTLTATLLGKVSGRDVYKIDLSMIVSKYIGETEKNLSKVFDIAQHKNWILFFDEADALFGKRTATNSSNDRHANQQTAYLLQRIEDFPGVVILASNLKANMDEAFTRRFQSVIHFAMPDPEERLQLWKQAFSGPCVLHAEIDLDEIAGEYEIAGGSITNVLRYCALSAIRRNDFVVTKAELLRALKNEFKKENKLLSIAG